MMDMKALQVGEKTKKIKTVKDLGYGYYSTVFEYVRLRKYFIREEYIRSIIDVRLSPFYMRIAWPRVRKMMNTYINNYFNVKQVRIYKLPLDQIKICCRGFFQEVFKKIGKNTGLWEVRDQYLTLIPANVIDQKCVTVMQCWKRIKSNKEKNYFVNRWVNKDCFREIAKCIHSLKTKDPLGNDLFFKRLIYLEHQHSEQRQSN